MSKSHLTLEGKVFLQPTMIRHTAKMIGCYLWRGDQDQTKVFARTLRDILMQAPKAMEFLSYVDRNRALYVIDCFDQGIDPTPWASGSTEICSTVVVPKDRLPENWSELDVCRVITDDQSLLDPLCDVDAINRLRTEAIAGDGRIDIAFSTGRVEHVVEVKTCTADHRVVGQVQKYMRSVGSLVHYNLFDHVQGWVIAPNFSDDTRIQLSEIGVKMVRLLVK